MRRGGLLIGAVLGLVLACAIVIIFWNGSSAGAGHTVPWFHPKDRITELANTGDGRAVLTLAQHGRETPIDPRYPHDTGFRWARPLPVILTWVFALGHRSWMPYSMMGLSIVGAGLLAAVAGALLGDEGVPAAWLGALVILAPGVIAGLQWFSMDALGLALALWGWHTNNRLLMAVAGLHHEVLLIFALARRKLLPLAVFGAWLVIVAFVWGYGSPSSATRFGSGRWGFRSATVPLLIAATAALGLVALLNRRFRWPAVGFLGLMPILGPLVYYDWQNFTRVLLSLWILGFIAVSRFVALGKGGLSHDPRLREPSKLRS
jgi:hypothetical protein